MSFAITNVEGPATSKGKLSVRGVEYDTSYLVYFSGTFDPTALLHNTDSRLPKPGQFWAVDSNAYCHDIEVDVLPESPANDSDSAVPIASYHAKWVQATVEELYLSPLSRSPQIECEGTDDKWVALYDKDGNAITNSAGDLFENLPEQYLPACVITITRNESSNPINAVAEFSNTANSSSWHGVGIENAFMGKIKAQKKEESVLGTTVIYWQVTYPIYCKVGDHAWRFRPIDCGYRILDLDGNPMVYKDEFLERPTVPILLDGEGNKLDCTPPDCDGVIYPEDGRPILDTMDFNGLSLPNPFA